MATPGIDYAVTCGCDRWRRGSTDPDELGDLLVDHQRGCDHPACGGCCCHDCSWRPIHHDGNRAVVVQFGAEHVCPDPPAADVSLPVPS